MRFLHLADLHIGKKLCGISLLDDQRYILEQILTVIDKYSPNAVIIAGDVYDSVFPPAEAVTLLDWFLTEILAKKKLLFIISGNHDSPERLAFGGRIMKSSGLYIEGVFSGAPTRVSLEDQFGTINMHMLPFIKPAHVNAFYGENLETYDGAMKYVLSKTKINNDERNILLAHQFVTANGVPPELSDSEVKYAGGLDNVDYAAFREFDYVALGHLHASQKVGRDSIIYGGSPLKYSISERFQSKCAVIADILEKGNVVTQKVCLYPRLDLRQIKGPIEKLLSAPETDDYIAVILTDTRRCIEPYRRLKEVYRNCISVEYEADTETDAQSVEAENEISRSPIDVFRRFYSERTGEELSGEDEHYAERIFDEIMGG